MKGTELDEKALPERKMTLRFTTKQFEQLDEKRFRLRTTFQAVGQNLFVSWLLKQGVAETPTVSTGVSQDSNKQDSQSLWQTLYPDTSAWHNLLELILKHGPDETCSAIQENLRTFARGVFLEISLENAETGRSAAGSFDSRLQAIESGLREAVLAPGKERAGKARNSGRNQREKRSA